MCFNFILSDDLRQNEKKSISMATSSNLIQFVSKSNKCQLRNTFKKNIKIFSKTNQQ